MKYVMVVDLNQCVGCDTCTVACKLDNETGAGVKWGRVIEEEDGTFPNVKRAFVPLLCMQCDDAQCIKVCPSGASYRNNQGLVQIDYTKCVGCRYCVIACPFMARQFNEARRPPAGVPSIAASDSRKGVVEKCDFCADRLMAGGKPVCVESCPYEARVFGDIEDPNGEVARIVSSGGVNILKPEGRFSPSVYYVGVK
jgi:dimethyl sulfoxide reductase iron-sulfur subunit